ncbi:MAG: GNAT family N-acetyltransferase [Clostridiales bacterium]|jgi:GNAT superfamily N-acetyltransferase|nr:GNAT family N-acetyltransferase [Clostridiales bacterium]
MSEITVIETTEPWQRAGVYYVRTEGMVKGFNIPLDVEFEDDGENREYSLLLIDGFPTATCRVKILDAQTGKIERVCVLESQRGKGVGKRLILETERRLKSRNVNKIIIFSRDAAVGFYEKLGYKADWTNTKDGFFKEVHTEKILEDGSYAI